LEEAEKPIEEEEIKEEEVKPPKAEIEEEIVEERFYTIPLGKAWLMPPNKRAPKAIRIIRDFIKRHMRLEARKEGEEEEEAEPKRLIISNEVNEKVWSRGIEKPPRKIRVRVARDKDGNVTVYLAEGD
jgi:large subunit ribosomal protein L31e